MPEVEEFRSPESGDLTSIDLFKASRGRRVDDWRRYLAWNWSPFNPTIEYVLERRNFNRFRREAVPARDAIRTLRERTGDTREVEHGGWRWTERALTETRYVRPFSIVIQRYELWEANLSSEAYRQVRGGGEVRRGDSGLTATLAPWLGEGTTVVAPGAIDVDQIGVVYVTGTASAAVTGFGSSDRLLGAAFAGTHTGAPLAAGGHPPGERIDEGWRFVLALLGPEELLDHGEPRWERVGPLRRTDAGPLPAWRSLRSGIARWPRWAWLVSAAALLLLVSQVAFDSGGSAGEAGTPTPVASPTATPLIEGAYSGAIAVLRDPHGHGPTIGPMPVMLDVRLTRDSRTNAYVLEIGGPAPFVAVSSAGGYNPATRKFIATGSGVVGPSRIPVEATLAGTLTAGGTLSATYTLSGTPNGPITYQVSMSK